MWKYRKDWDKNKKTVLTIIFALFFVFVVFLRPEQDNGSASIYDESTASVSTMVPESTETETAAAEIPETTAVPVTAEIPATVPETTVPVTAAPETLPPETTVPATVPAVPATEYIEKVWINDTGEKYHKRSDCSNMKGAYQVPIDQARAMGKEACKKCY